MFCTVVPKKKILPTAINLVSKSKNQILLTMNLDEEISNPLPQIYLNKLQYKSNRGIHIVRLGFGKKQNFKKLYEQKPKFNNFKFIFAGSLKNYLRMIVVYREKAIFKLEDKVFYTDYKPLINSLIQLFNDNLTASKKVL